MNIVVLAGGLSPERNVSLSSGVMVAKALRERGHRAALADLYLGTEEDGEALYEAPLPEEWARVAREAPDLAALAQARGGRSLFGPGILRLCQEADAVFLALHGQGGEDGRVQAAFDLMGIAYTGSGYLSSAIAMNKDLTKKLAAPLGVLTPAWEALDCGGQDIAALAARLRLPCVVKPVDGGSSIGVAVCRTRAELEAALRGTLAFGGRCVAEDYVAGREIAAAILEDRALPPVEIVPKTGFYDYQNKYQPGAAEEICPAPIPARTREELAQAALAVFRAVGLSVYARADFILGEDGRVWFLEINTLPGMTPTSLLPQAAAAAGIGYAELCERIVTASLEQRGRQWGAPVGTENQAKGGGADGADHPAGGHGGGGRDRAGRAV